MANSKSIVIIAGIAVAIIIGIALAASFEGADSPVITQDEVVIEEGTVQTTSPGDTASIEESVEITKSETKFFINEDGTKTYVIDVRDTPSIDG